MVHPTADWATQQFREVLDDLYQIQAGLGGVDHDYRLEKEVA
jgi:hypothetical protein